MGEAVDQVAFDLAEMIRRWTGNRAQVIGRTPKQIARLRRAKEPILFEWTQDLVVIAGERTTLGRWRDGSTEDTHPAV